MLQPSIRRGSVLILVMLSVLVAMIGGLTLVMASSSQVASTVVIAEYAQARQTAESTLAGVLAYIERTPDWRSNHSPGMWIEEAPLLGGSISVQADFDDAAESSPEIDDASFESQVASLATPLFGPPMSGVIGGWEVRRTALVQTGLTVPKIGTRLHASATDGGAQAYINFGASVTGSGTFAQNLGKALQPNAIYTLTADIDPGGLLPLDQNFGFRVYAGGTLVASTQEALVLVEGLAELLGDLQQAAEELLDGALLPSTLLQILLSGSTSRYTLTFATDATPPPGEIRIQLFAQSVGLLNTITFDNITMEATSDEPITLRALARNGSASHAVTAIITTDFSGRCKVLEWNER